MTTAYDLRERRLRFMAAANKLNEAYSASPVYGLTRNQIFDAKDSGTFKSMSRRMLNALVDQGYLQKLGKSPVLLYRPLKKITPDVIDKNMLPYSGDTAQSPVQQVDTALQAVLNPSSPLNDEEEPQEETESEETHEAPPPISLPSNQDPLSFVINFLNVIHHGVERIQKRMTLIEHRQMEMQEKIDALHEVWTK